MKKGPNYDTEVVKHYVRKSSWLQPFKAAYNRAERDYKNSKRTDRFKYLTFCAKNAIDVFLLEKEGLLYRDTETSRLVNVYFCEENDEDFIAIKQLIGSENQGFYGKFEKLLFEEFELDEPESDNEEFNEVDDEAVRQLIRLKESQDKLYASFPFDAINLDVYGHLFPKNGDRYSEQCKMFSKVLDLQKSEDGIPISKFVLYLTVFTPLEENEMNQEAYNELLGSLFENMKYDFFRNGIKDKYDVETPDKLDFHIKYTFGFLKKVILREAYKHGWVVKVSDLYCYDRSFKKSNDRYKMSCYVLEFEREQNLDNSPADFQGAIPSIVENKYKVEIERFINSFPKNAPSKDNISNTIREDLEGVVEFREKFLQSIKNEF